MSRFRMVIGCFALVVALTGAACSSGGDDIASKDPEAAMKAASSKTAGSGTVKLVLTATGAKKVTVLSGSGAYDFDKKWGRFTLKTAQGSAADMVITADELYLKLPQKTPADKPWVGVTSSPSAVSDPNSAEATVRAYLDSIRRQVDPRSTLDALATSVPSLKKVGTQKIRGTDTTHLAGRVDLSDKAIAAAPADKQEALRQAKTAFGSDGYPVDVWFDHQGRVRRVEYVLETGTGAQATSTTVRLDLYDFGGKSGIVIPPVAQVGDANSLFPTTTTTPTTAPAKKK